MGVRIARKHVGWYLNADRDMREQHRHFNRLTAPDEQLYYIQQLSGFAFNKEIAA